MQQKPTRKEKRQAKTQGVSNEGSGFKLLAAGPKTENQGVAFKAYDRGDTLFMHGLPGTGKTFIALYLALKSVLVDKTHRKVVIVRSAVPTRDIGFMPGSAGEKMKAYEAPYAVIATELFGRADAYEILKQKKVVEFIPTSFIRGLTIDDAVIVVEEAQNMSYQEVRSVVTRVGQNSRLVIAADRAQDDLTSERFKEQSGIDRLTDIMRRIDGVTFVDFEVQDILRSDFIKKFIMAEYGIVDDVSGKALAAVPMLAARH